jgi:hypothetical protein
MTPNLELPLRESRKPKVSAEEVDALCAFLAGKGWVKAKEIEAQIEVDDRRMRVIAEVADGRIISGQKGYKLFDRSTPIGEADEAACRIEAMCKKGLLHAAAIRRRIHRYARERAPAA